jgi:methylenetetrahydrofolate reductase (NADPH)
VLAVHNDFHETHGIFPVFEGLEIADIDKPLHVVKDIPIINGSSKSAHDTADQPTSNQPTPN